MMRRSRPAPPFRLANPYSDYFSPLSPALIFSAADSCLPDAGTTVRTADGSTTTSRPSSSQPGDDAFLIFTRSHLSHLSSKTLTLIVS
eukprot:6195005-Pleurochrysis_carterae.AAC.4